MSRLVNCSRCGEEGDLHFVTCGEAGGSNAGRALVYCAQCRRDMKQHIDISLPLKLMTSELLLSLYRLGKTDSDPEMAIEMVFGEINELLVKEASSIMISIRN